MDILLKQTNTKDVRPMLVDNIKQTKRHAIFAKLFEGHGAYRLFSKPETSHEAAGIMRWNTDFETPFFQYDKLPEGEKIRFNAVLKNQLKHLYNRALYIYETDPENKNIFKVLDRALEIPDYSDINITDFNGKHFIVLSRWGTIYDAHNAKTGLIQKLVPLKIKDIQLNFIFDDNSSAANKQIEINLLGKTNVYTTDHNGILILGDVPFFEKYSVSYRNDKNEIVVNQSFECDSKDSQTIVLPKPLVIIPKIEPPIEQIPEKKLPEPEIEKPQPVIPTPPMKEPEIQPVSDYNKLFEEDKKKEPELIHIDIPYTPPEPKILAIARTLTVIDQNNKPISVAKIHLDGVRFESNALGKVSFSAENGSLVKVQVSKKRNHANHELFINQALEYTVQLRIVRKFPIFWVLLGLALLLGSLFLWLYINDLDKYRHKAFISGYLIHNEYKKDAMSEAFKPDNVSVTLEEGIYNFQTDMKQVVDYTFDGMAIGEDTRLVVFEKENGFGKILIDTVGPLIINNLKWKSELKFNFVNTENWGGRLQNVFPPERRMWSPDSLSRYENGSVQIKFLNK